ncbi:hypothetical protein OAV88_02535 [bacterium]|nr:hypothetical protein [bacterium]
MCSKREASEIDKTGVFISSTTASNNNNNTQGYLGTLFFISLSFSISMRHSLTLTTTTLPTILTD